MNKFYAIFMLIILIASAVEPGHGIKCYNCDSTIDKECVEIKKDTSLVAETCTPSVTSRRTGNWLADLIRIDYMKGDTEMTVPMVCQKIVGSNENGVNITLRGCQLDAGKSDQCQITYTKAKMMPGVQIHLCSICTEDECNGALGRLDKRTSLTIATGMTLLAMVLTNKILF